MKINKSRLDNKTTCVEVNYTKKITSGNIIPLEWYKFITTASGRPDHNAITILSEIFYWYRPKVVSDPKTGNKAHASKFSGDLWQTSYRHFEEKFTYNHQRIRRALVLLEKLNLIERVITNIKFKGQRYANVLFIKLNINALNKILPPNLQIKTFNSNLKKEQNKLGSSQASNIHKNVVPSLHICRDHMKSKINKESFKSRSSGSNFIENNLSDKKEALKLLQLGFNTITSIESRTNILNRTTSTNISLKASLGLIDKVKVKFTSNKRKSFTECYPVSEDETYNLSVSTGREFNQSYINKLTLKFGKKYPEHGFYTRALFLEYMKKALLNELRDAVVVNNESFRFKENDQEAQIHKHLNEIEESRDTSILGQVKRTIASSFDKTTAYKILTYCELPGEIVNNAFRVKVLKPLTLTEHQNKELLKIIKSFYDNPLQDISLQYLEFIPGYNFTDDKPKLLLSLNLGIEGSIWRRISTKLLEYYGEGIHRSWFSKLEAIEDNELDSMKKLILKAPSNFIKDWISSNYSGKISEYLQSLGWKLGSIEASL